MGEVPAPPAGNEMELRFPARPENVGLARVAVAAFASQLPFTLPELEEIKVAVSEAVSNAVVHAYDGGEGAVRVRACRRDGVLEIVVSDRGRGIEDVRRAREPSFTTAPGRMGLGFAFMEAFMDRVEVASAPGRGTRVRMWKRAGGRPGPGED